MQKILLKAQLKYLRELDLDQPHMIIIEESVFTDDAEIVDIYGQGCNYSTGKGVEGFQVDYDIVAFNENGEEEAFHLIYQSSDRSDNRMAYSGYEMQSINYANDESVELAEFVGHDTYQKVVDIIGARAEALCEGWLNASSSIVRGAL